MPPPRAILGWLIAIGASATLAFAAKCAPGITSDDPAELQYLSVRLGLAHNTGYPLFVWLGHVATWVPVGSPAWRVSALSAVWGGLTVAASAALGYALAPGAWPTRIAGATLVAVALVLSPTIAGIASTAEPYALATALGGLVPLCLWRWERSAKRRWIAAAGAALGLALTAHPSAIVLAPPALAFTLFAGKRFSLTDALAGTVATVAAAIVAHPFLAWLLWRRHLATDYWHAFVLRTLELQPLDDPSSFVSVWWFLARMRDARHRASDAALTRVVTGAPSDNQLGELALFVHRAMSQATPLLSALAILGAVVLVRRQRALGAYVVAVPITTALFLSAFTAGWPKAQLFGAHAWIAVAVLGGVGLVAACEWAAAHARKRWVRPVAMAALVASGALLHARYVERLRTDTHVTPLQIDAMLGAPYRSGGDRDMERFARGVLAAVPNDAILLSHWTTHYALLYEAERAGRDTIRVEELATKLHGLSAATRGVLARWERDPVFVVSSRDPGRILGLRCYELELVVPELYRVTGDRCR